MLAELDAAGVAAVQDAIVQAVQAKPAAEDDGAPAGVCLTMHQTSQKLCAGMWIMQAKPGIKLFLK